MSEYIHIIGYFLEPITFIVAFLGIFAFLGRYVKLLNYNKFKLPSLVKLNIIKLYPFIVILACLIFPLILLKDNFKADWGVIDDHEVVYIIGNQDRLDVKDYLPTLIYGTEIGNPGGYFKGYKITYTRFRPFYYGLRLLEAVIWGNNVKLWYAFRAFLLFISSLVLIYIFKPLFKIQISLAISAYIFTFPFWGDIFSRLGPSETYSVPGLTIFLWGYFGIIKNNFQNSNLNKYWFALAIGSIICMGSKENFLILLISVVGLLIVSIINKKFLLSKIWFYFLIYSFGGAMLLILLQRLYITKLNVYQEPISITNRLQNLLTHKLNIFFLASQTPILFIILTMALLLIWLIFIRKNLKVRNLQRFIEINIIGCAILIVIYTSQLFFYNFNWPLWNRYDFPGYLTIPAFILLQIWFISKIILSIKGNEYKKILEYSLLATLILFIMAKGFTPIIIAVENNVSNTNQFQQFLLKLSMSLKNCSECRIVIKSNDIYDYEKIFSTEKYLLVRGIKNKIYLSVDYAKSANMSELEKFLANDLEIIAKEGDGRLIIPLETSNTPFEKCVYVSMSLHDQINVGNILDCKYSLVNPP